jgi:uncharacterized protein YndB with AHSA1/START domain
MSNTHITITRIFEAPRERVWNAWVEPKEMMKWWGPKKFTAPIIRIDPRVGGTYLSCMRGSPEPGMPEQDFWSTGRYLEIVPLKKLIMTDSFSDKDGNVISAEQYGMKGFPLELLVTVTFEDEGGNTKMTLRHEGMTDPGMAELTKAGWNESFDKLEESLK